MSYNTDAIGPSDYIAHTDYSLPIEELSIKNKQDVFESIIVALKYYIFEVVDDITYRNVRFMLEAFIPSANKFFNNCRFVCDKRNNNTPEKELIVDFFFEEMDNDEKRCFRFILSEKHSDVLVVERRI